MSKTDEQKKADQLLTEAIEAVVRAYEMIAPEAPVVDFLVMGEGVAFLDDGTSTTHSFMAYKDGHCRLTTVLGLIELCKHNLMVDLQEEGDY